MKLLRRAALILAAAAPCGPALAVDFAMPADGAAPAALAAPPELPAGQQTIDGDIARLIAAYDAFPAAAHELPALAESLGGDAQAAFMWVRDTIRLDPYAGRLRDPEGVLAARGANAADRAVLLKALLDAMKVPARFAQAEISDSAALDRLMAASLAPRAGAPDAQALFRPETLDRIKARATRDFGALTGVLGAERLAAMDASPAGDGRASLAAHVWVQAEIGGAWVDLDTALPDATPGSTLVQAAQTPDTLDAVQAQTITFSLRATTGGSESEVLTHTITADEAANAQILLFFQPEQYGFSGIATQSTRVVPVLLINGEGPVGSALAAGAAGGVAGAIDLIGGESAPTLQKLTLHITTHAPGAPDVEAVRILTEVPDGAAMAEDELGPLPWRWLHHIVVSTGAISPRDFAAARLMAAKDALDLSKADEAALQALSLAKIVWPQTTGNGALAAMSERVFVEALTANGARAVIGRPRVTIVSSGPVREGERAGTSTLTDLMIDGVAMLAPPQTGTARTRIWYAALQTALETEFVLTLGLLAAPADRAAEGASLAIDGAPPVVFETVSELPATAPAAMRTQAEAGLRIIVAGDPAATRTWWTVGPDGETRSILDPSLGGGGGWNWGRPPPRPYYANAELEVELNRRAAQARQLRNQAPREPCQRGAPNEYLILGTCVSIPASWTAGAAVTAVVVEVAVFAILTIVQL